MAEEKKVKPAKVKIKVKTKKSYREFFYILLIIPFMVGYMLFLIINHRSLFLGISS